MTPWAPKPMGPIFVRDVASRIAMNELDLIGDAQFFSADFRLLCE